MARTTYTILGVYREPTTTERTAMSLCLWAWLWMWFWLLLALMFGQQAQALSLSVVDATNNNAISQFKYIINVDNAGTTAQRAPTGGCSPSDPNYPGSQTDATKGLPCKWTSIAGAASSAPIYTQGDQSNIGAVNPPAGRYLISVLADGYKLDGAHFTVPSGGQVTVQMQPQGLPAATLQAAVFEDISPVNGAPDVPAEHGLAGFQGHIADYIDEVTTDVFGNPLCTEYDGNGNPIGGTGGSCVSKCYVVVNGVDVGTVGPAVGRCPTETDGAAFGFPGQTLVVEGKLKIPNLGPNRYAASIVPPDGQSWQQTTTLEGNLDWDAWVMEGATGLDTEFVVAGEPFPPVIFGYVQTGAAMAGGSGSIKGVVDAVKVYVPMTGGISLPGTAVGGLSGVKIDKPVDRPWVALTDLQNGDTAVWVGQGNADGTFNIPSVPAGSYTLTWWDTNMNYILDLINVTVANGEAVDMGILPLTGWWTRIEGDVYDDANENGKRDPGENGLANYTVVMRKRENSLMDRGAVAVTTDPSGHYVMENAYPMTQWLVVEAYDDLHYGTGVTWQADNQPAETTVMGDGVDVSVLPIIGLSGRLDWGKHTYKPGTNGGIVGTVSYDTTRNELDPRYAAVENWQPGIPNLNVNLYQPVGCTASSTSCDATGRYELAADGAFAKGQRINASVTETWERPTGCIARDVNGTPLAHGTAENVLPTSPTAECLEGPLMGVQFQTGFSAVDGNYGFVDGCFGTGGFNTATQSCADGTDPTPLVPGDYLVEVGIPNDTLSRPLYQVTKEEDINIFNGDQFIPQIPPPECAGPLHTVDVAGIAPDGSGAIVNPAFVEGGGSPYEGQNKPLCHTKLVRVSNGRSVAPTFNLFTDVPLPGRFWGLLVDDLNFSSNSQSLLFGEKAGIPFAPVGIYDYTDRLVYTAESDYNGLFDVLLPSTNRIDCPTPSGVCANLYRFVGNDPGIPGRLNPNYRPEFRTIAAEFEAFPGLLVPADLAPTQVGVSVQLPGGQAMQPLSCPLSPTTPQLFAVSKPYAVRPASGAVPFTIRGLGFGETKGTGNVTLDGIPLTTTAWNNRQIVASIDASTPIGPHQLKITANNGQSTVNGLSFHVLGTGYAPSVIEVLSGQSIQAALDNAANISQALVVVYPGTPSANPRVNPRGAYYENLIVTSPVKLQGVGPGGVYPNGSTVPGSIIDGGAFGGDTALADAWRAKIDGLTWVGNQTVYDGETIYVLPRTTDQFGTSFKAAIDGFDLRGGDQMGFPANLNQTGGTPTGLPPNAVTQGGAIFANAYAHHLQITNNVIQNNGGAYGTVRIGTPNLLGNAVNQHNDHIRIANNRVFANGGTNLAGGIGIFAGSDEYEVAYNDICGNFSAEYGGGISVYGLSHDNAGDPLNQLPGKIHHNRVYFNRSYDEGGGIMIAGQLPSNPAALSPGSGPVDIYSNIIQANLANDDGGGIRFLMAGNYPMNVYNNFIVNNVSTHEGGGVSIDDAPDVRLFNNTIMKNLTTATAVTSDGSPAPAGLSTTANSNQLQSSLPGGAPYFSDPLLFNNIFWDNRAGTRAGSTVTGLGLTGDASPVNRWDMGALDPNIALSPTNSILQSTTGTVPSGSNQVGANPDIVTPYNLALTFAPWRTNPAFIGAIMVTADLPPTRMGDYHIEAESPAVNAGAGSKGAANAPSLDIDDGTRSGAPDIGADEQGIAGSGGGGGGGVITPTPVPTPAPALPLLGDLDNFNRADANTLGANWAQPGGAVKGIRVNTNQAAVMSAPRNAYWIAAFGASQGASFTFANTAMNNAALVLKASGGSASAPLSYIRVQYQTGGGGRVVVSTTVGGGFSALAGGTFAGSFAASDTLTATVSNTGLVSVFKNAAFVGSVQAPPPPAPNQDLWTTGGGMIGMQLPSAGTRIDDFRGGNI